MKLKMFLCIILPLFFVFVTAEDIREREPILTSASPVEADLRFQSKFMQCLEDAKVGLLKEIQPLQVPPVTMKYTVPFGQYKLLDVVINFGVTNVTGLSQISFNHHVLMKTANSNVLIFTKVWQIIYGALKFISSVNTNALGMTQTFVAEVLGYNVPSFLARIHYNLKTDFTHVNLYEISKPSFYVKFHSKQVQDLESFKRVSSKKIIDAVNKGIFEGIKNILRNMNLKPLKPILEEFARIQKV